MKSKHLLGVTAVTAVALTTVIALGQPQKAILNASQLGVEDLDLGFGEDDLTTTEESSATAAVAEPVVEANDTPVEKATEETDDVGLDLGLDLGLVAAEEATPAVAEPVVEEVAAEPVVEEVAAKPAGDDLVDSALGEEIDDILGDDDDTITPVVTEPDPATESVAVPVEETTAAEGPVKETPVAEGPVESAAETPAEKAVAETAPAAKPETIDPEQQEDSEMAKVESLRRQLLIKHGRDCLAQGYDNLRIGNWAKAIEKFNDTLRFLPDIATTHEDILSAHNGLGEAYYRTACELRDKQSWDEAEKNCREARSYQHPKAEDLLKQIRSLQTNPPPPPPKVILPRKKQPEYISGRKDIEERLKLAKQYYATGEYNECLMYTELVLHDYPWCPEAIAMLRKLDKAKREYNLDEREAIRNQMITDVVKTWVPQSYGKDYTLTDVLVSRGEDGTGQAVSELTAEMRIRDKMKRIVIPEISFRQANIVDVVDFLSDSSREYDAEDVPAEERGVNFVLDLGDGGSAAAASTDTAVAADDPWGAPAETTTESSAVGGVPQLTIKSRYVSLQSTLDMIMDMSGLKYRIQGNVVMIMPKNKAEGELVHRMYNVLPSIGERINTIGASKTEGSGDAGDPFAMSAGTTETTTDWKSFFQKLGVNWPDESSVTYMPSIGKLVVKNTATNLATLEQVLGALNVTPFQVEVEVRFVEVGQTDLNSLGLEWILNDDWEIMENKADAALNPASRRRVSMAAGSINSGFNYLSNNSNVNFNGGNAIADNIATFTSILTNPEFSLVLHALANKSNADLLSAPKVVAMNGSQATVKTVVEFIYPTEYDVEMLESSSDDDTSTYTGAVVEPQNFFTREVGVILQVTPRVSADGTRIGLDLTPSVVSEPTWKNYGSTYPVYNTNPITGLSEMDYVQLMMEQPFFPVRSLATSVEIYNGSTVVMGGMIREERYTEEDKIPILGDIPLLGRLFRYKSEQSTKRNLLIFVSARLVDPAGRRVKSDSNALVGAATKIDK